MAYYGRPAASYYEAEEEVVRVPGGYSSEYRVEEYANSGYPMGPPHHHHHHNGGVYEDRVTEVVSYESNPGYLGHHHHHHGGVAEVVEKREEIIYEKPYPYGRMY